jgi:hypothetical protein
MKPSSLMSSSPFWLGAALLVLAPVVVPVLRPATQAVAKAVIMGGLQAYRTIRATSLATAESLANLYEEARYELNAPDDRKNA